MKGIDLNNLSPNLVLRAIEELDRREQLKKARIKLVPLDEKFPEQSKFILDTAKFLGAQCTRRAGKTTGLAIRFCKTMEKHPGTTSLYLAMTRESAKEIMWPVMEELNEQHGLGYEFIESKLIIIHPNGSRLKLMGADMKNFVKRIRGRKYPAIGIDEAQDFGSHLQSLIDDVLTPSIADFEDGWLAVTGTPGPVPMGYFFDITRNRRFGYSVHEWSILNNPYMPNPEKFIQDLIQKREWKEDNPTLLREWRNKWVLDVESLWVKYLEHCNFESLPPRNYHYIAGIDVGFKDADAIAVMAYSFDSPDTYLIEESINTKQGLTELVNEINRLNTKYKFTKMVIDEGGLGKKLAEELRRRHSIPVHPADKARKQETVEFLNDAIRLNKFKAKSNSRFAQDSYLVQIDWERSSEDKIVLKKGFHSDIIDAAIYAFKESPAYAYVKPKEAPKYGTPEWIEAQTDGLFEKALEYHQKKTKFDQY